MASLKTILVICGLAGLLAVAEVDGACDVDAIGDCVDLIAGGDQASMCKYISCATKAGVNDCTGANLALKTTFDSYKDLYKCGAAQFLMSWPLYLTVLALTLKQIYSKL